MKFQLNLSKLKLNIFQKNNGNICVASLEAKNKTSTRMRTQERVREGERELRHIIGVMAIVVGNEQGDPCSKSWARLFAFHITLIFLAR